MDIQTLEQNRTNLVHAWQHLRDPEEVATGPILSKDWSMRLQVSLLNGGRVYDLTIDPDGNIRIVRGPDDSVLVGTDGSIIG